MKNKFLLLVTFLTSVIIGYTQSSSEVIKDFGYNTWDVTSLPSNANASFDVIFEDNDIFYVNTSNRICHIKKIAGVWQVFAPLTTDTTTIRAGGQMHRAGNKIYYVGSNWKIYQLENPYGTWINTCLSTNKSQIKVRSDADILYSDPHVYYIGTNDFVCDFVTVDGGINWTNGVQLVWPNSITVRPNSKLIQPINTALLYYISINNTICELGFNNGWSGGQWPINTETVKSGTNLETNGYGLFYVNSSSNNNKVSTLYWDNTYGWLNYNLPCIEDVRTDVPLKYHENTIFYVGISGKLNILSQDGVGNWAAIPVDVNSPTVKINSKLLVYYNPIFEEGSSWATFKSSNVFFVDTNNKLCYYVYDDIPCDNPHNRVWNTNACKVGGVFPKAWHFGPDVNIEQAKTVKPNFRIGKNNKDIYFIENGTNLIKKLNRESINNPVITDGLEWSLSFQDEFDALLTTKDKWNPQFPNGNVHQIWNKAHYKDYDNLYFNNGIMSIEAKEDNSNWPFWRKGSTWNDSCLLTPYPYTSSSLQTNCLNCNYNSLPDPVKLINCGPTVKLKTFTQIKGWFETRSKTPRGKGMWNAFWLIPENQTWNYEIDVFEIPGNGKYVSQSNWTDFIVGGGRNAINKIVNCIGYRTYEDFHTYSVKWHADHLLFYYDNKEVGDIVTDYIPDEEMYMILNNYVDEELSDPTYHMIESEVEIFPNYWDVDYVRSYTEPVMIKTINTSKYGNITELEISPTPANNFITTTSKMKNISSVVIYDLVGRNVKSFSYDSSNSYNVSDIPTGIYVITISNGAESATEKILINRD